MPDWSYQTLFRPLLFRLPSRTARHFTLQSMRRVSRLPGGTFLIKTLGHMEPSPLLESRIAGVPVQTPVGLSGGVDPQGIAHRALSQFGFGFVEIGPVTVHSVESHDPIIKDEEQESLVYPCEYENEGLQAIIRRINHPEHHLPQFIRIAPMPGASVAQAADEMRILMDAVCRSGASGLYLDCLSIERDLEQNLNLLMNICGTVGICSETYNVPLFLYIPLDFPEKWVEALCHEEHSNLWHGFVIGNAIRQNEQVRIGQDGKQLCLSKVRLVRDKMSEKIIIKASAGIHEPSDAVDMIQAGADYVLLQSGLVYSGPGLPKRVNEAIMYEKVRHSPLPAEPSFWKHWGWMCLLGMGMVIGGILAWIIAASSVLLPYDEAFLGMNRAQVNEINDRLLHFMSHDRITLAGTMISIGILYYQLAKNGLKYGLHWAKTALMTSGIVGFSSFFLYLGYGFFDPIHALAAAVLFPMFILSMRGNPDQPFRKPVNLRNNREWRLAMWGQLCLVVVGFSLSIGGLVISGVGVTQVFVPEDLAFLDLTPQQLDAVNTRLIPLIAHDRAGFGGALFSDAVLILILALWGLAQGERWLWWTLLGGGTPGFLAGLSVHFGIGYTDFLHLLPAYFVFVLYVAGLILLYPYLMKQTERPPVGGPLSFANVE